MSETVLCDFITEGHFGRHLCRMREVYAERLLVLIEARGKDWRDCWKFQTQRPIRLDTL